MLCQSFVIFWFDHNSPFWFLPYYLPISIMCTYTKLEHMHGTSASKQCSCILIVKHLGTKMHKTYLNSVIHFKNINKYGLTFYQEKL